MSDESRIVHGIDFSGAADAWKKIWIATGELSHGRLFIQQCRPVSALSEVGWSKEQSYPALVRFIAGRAASIIGFDFPFSLPAALMAGQGWDSFALSFWERHPDPSRFRSWCWEQAGEREIRRATDCEAKTPFSPYNLRLYRQTYFGIRDVLAPLVREEAACVLPMQRPIPGRPWVLEVCPASTLKRSGIYNMSYKKRTDGHRGNRRDILAHLERSDILASPPQSIVDTVLGDTKGDALDSLIAACATARFLMDPDAFRWTAQEPFNKEGYVYL